MSAGSVVVRDVEVRTWPECIDLVVIDQSRALALAYYPIDDEDTISPICDPRASYERRARAALNALEQDQEFLQAHFELDSDHNVRLHPTDQVRERIAELLGGFGLQMQDIALPELRVGVDKLNGLDPDRLYELLCDWHDTVERHYPAGSSQLDETSWVHRARPSDCYQHHYLAAGIETREGVTPEQTDVAYELFKSLIDVPAKDLKFGHVLRWVYFHRVEFPERDPFALRALQDLQASV